MGDTSFFFKELSREIESTSRHFDNVVLVEKSKNVADSLLQELAADNKSTVTSVEELEPNNPSPNQNSATATILNGTLNFSLDIQGLLGKLRDNSNRRDRVIAVLYNPYLRFAHRLTRFFNIEKEELPSTFITRTDLRNLAKISGYEVVRTRYAIATTSRLFGLGTLCNRIVSVIPVLRWLSFVYLATLRPVVPDTKKPSLSIVIPARNERGNIRNALERMPKFDAQFLEIIFVEGHSRDGTWEEILSAAEDFSKDYEIQCIQQSGVGKADAVRLGFSKAKGDVLTILDADLTVEPELLPRFYDAYCRGDGDFINGSRLVYPTEGEAMRFLNKLGNVFFAKALSFVLDTKIGDSLCGTKLLSRYDYERMVRWRKQFGDFDPFGDFELLFPAAMFGLGIVDIPIHYRKRSYGETNISRFTHGALLLKMTAIGMWRIKLGVRRTPAKRE